MDLYFLDDFLGVESRGFAQQGGARLGTRRVQVHDSVSEEFEVSARGRLQATHHTFVACQWRIVCCSGCHQAHDGGPTTEDTGGRSRLRCVTYLLARTVASVRNGLGTSMRLSQACAEVVRGFGVGSDSE